MSRLIELEATHELVSEIGIAGLVNRMKEAGFVFLTESCPFTLAEPKKVIPLPNGVRYQQWVQS